MPLFYQTIATGTSAGIHRKALDALTPALDPQYNRVMRIATYNIHGWRTAGGASNWTLVARVLEEIGADIVGLNEVFHPRTVDGMEAPALTALAARLDMHVVFGPCLRWPAQNDMPENAYGNALLSRWPILASAAHHLTPKEVHLQAAVAGKEERGLLEGRISLPGDAPLTVYVTHLDHSSEAARLAQLRTLRTWTSRDRKRPHMVMGDFNAISRWDWDESGLEYLASQAENRGGNLVDGDGPQVVSQMEKAGYVDLYPQFGEPGQRSFLSASDKNLRIDYLFASRSLVPLVTACGIWPEGPGEQASDHSPVWADLSLETV